MTLFGVISIFIAVFGAAVCIGLLITSNQDQEKQTMNRLAAIASVGAIAVGSEEPVDLRRGDPLGTSPWVERVLLKLNLAQRLRLLLVQAGLDWTAAKLFAFMAAAFALTGLLAFLRTWTFSFALILGLCGATLPLFFVVRKRASRFYRFKELLPEALDTMVAAIRAGHSFNSALGMTARESMEPIRSELRQCFDEQNFGLDLRTSLGNLEQRVPLSDIRIMVAAILIQRETGGNLTEILDRVSYLIREEFRLQRQVMVHTAQGRLTGWILSCLPPVLAFLMYLLNPGHMSLLWQRSAGIKMIWGAAIMTTIGALIIRKIVRVRL